MNDNTPKPRVEWRGREDFAEVAEALGVSTDQVMALHSDGTVLWTVGNDIYRAHLVRDEDGIVIPMDEQYLSTTEEFQAEVKKLMKEAMTDAG